MVWLVVVVVVVAVLSLLAGLTVRRDRRGTPAPADVEMLLRLAADLHRLSVNLAEVEGARAPAKMARMRAALLAYDDELLCACRALQLPAPARSPLDPLERLETEAVLAQHGLHW
ncbi:MAG: hypothetical protein ACRDV1_09250 [Actinomycetes bacterium]